MLIRIGRLFGLYDSILYIGDAESYTFNSFLTAAQIAAAGLLGGTYECCIYLSLDAGWTEQDSVDNIYCMYVTFASGGVNTYTVTATAGAGGSVSRPEPLLINAGDNATYQIIANNCYQVSDVLVDGNPWERLIVIPFRIFKLIIPFRPLLFKRPTR